MANTTHTYRVRFATENTEPKDIKAAYLQHEDGMIVFKDATHAITFAVSATLFLSAERLPSGNPTPARRNP